MKDETVGVWLVVWVRVGFQQIYKCALLQALSNKKKDPIIKGVLSSVLEDVADPWTAQVRTWSRIVGLSSFVGVSRARVCRQVEMWSISKVQSMIKEHRSLVTLSEPSKWSSLQPHVNDSAQSRIINRIRAADVGLGNPTRVAPHVLRRGILTN